MESGEITYDPVAGEARAEVGMADELLGRDDILNYNDATFQVISVPEWGGKVRIRGLTAAERDSYEQSLTVGKGANIQTNMHLARAKLAQLCIVDAAGKQLFTRQDIAKLGAKSAVALERVFDTARHLSGLTAEDLAELTGNSEPGQNGGSPSA